MPTAAEKARDQFLAGFAKSYGSGTASIKTANNYDVIPTGSMALDRAMSTGGYVIGRETELWGPPDGGKSSLCLIAAREAQVKFPDKYVMFVDVEHKFDAEWARTLGADPERIILIDPLTAEDTADMVKDSIRANIASMVIVDSIGAVLTHNEFEKAAKESDMGKRAQVVSRMILIATGLAPRHNIAVLVINQARANFGYGADTKSAGGFVPAHSSTHKLHVKRVSTSYMAGPADDQFSAGYEMGVKVERSKVGPQGRNVKFDFYTVATDKFGPVGIDKAQEAFQIGKREHLIDQAGAWYHFNGEKFNGEKPIVAYLREHQDAMDKIRAELVAKGVGEVVLDTPPELTYEQAKEVGIA